MRLFCWFPQVESALIETGEILLSTTTSGEVVRFIGAFAAACVFIVALGGCQRPSQNTYRAEEVGKSSAVSFGTVLAIREIDIIGRNTGAGALGGGAVGAGAASYVGSGNAWAIGGGLLAGAIIGALAEQAMADRKGLEYTVILESGVTLTVTQEKASDDTPIAKGDRVIVQNTGGYQRVLPAATLPTAVKRPQGIKVVD
jgi:outer membrane lipoprotein SlyB